MNKMKPMQRGFFESNDESECYMHQRLFSSYFDILSFIIINTPLIFFSFS